VGGIHWQGHLGFCGLFRSDTVFGSWKKADAKGKELNEDLVKQGGGKYSFCRNTEKKGEVIILTLSFTQTDA